MRKVLIIGASKGIGLETVKCALKARYSVRALSRSATAIRLRDPKLEKLDGDALDRNTVERSLVGVDAVIQTLGVPSAPPQILTCKCVSLPGETCSAEVSTSTKSCAANQARSVAAIVPRLMRYGLRVAWTPGSQNGGFFAIYRFRAPCGKGW